MTHPKQSQQAPPPLLCESSLSQKCRKRLRSKVRYTPWRDTWELDQVGRSLLSAGNMFGLSSASEQQQQQQPNGVYAPLVQDAIRKVAVWKSRSDQGRIPHSMETTAALAEALYQDKQSEQLTMAASTSSVLLLLHPSTFQLRLAYASALMRGINGIADNLQQNRQFQTASSVASLCDMVGLPGWLVDLRHDAAHNDLPSLSALRLAAQTFLKYLERHYWTKLSEDRWKIRNRAMELLQKYKAASKPSKSTMTTDARTKATSTTSSTSTSSTTSSRRTPSEGATIDAGNEPNENNSTSDSEEDSPDDWMDDLIWGQNIGTNQNRFAAFNTADQKNGSNARKRAKWNNCDTKGGEETNHTTTARSKKKKGASANKDKDNNNNDDSPLHHAQQFIKTVPMDIGFQVALSFLVWGGMNDSQPEGRGALIPGSPVSFPATAEGAFKIQRRYKVLISTLCVTWPGFASSLLLHLVDFVLAIECQTKNDNALGKGDANSQQPQPHSKPHELVVNTDAGAARKVFFLFAWVKFLLSREFHSVYDRSIAVIDQDGIFDLSKKPASQWTKEERVFLQSAAPLAALQRAQFSLNSLCDRCDHFHPERGNGLDVLPQQQENETSLEIRKMFCDILKIERVPLMGIRSAVFQPSERHSKKERVHLETTETNATVSTMCNSSNDDTALLPSGTRISETMSLNDMEVLLCHNDCAKNSEIEQADARPDADRTAAHISHLHSLDKCPPSLVVWAKCQEWEPCAIGTLPGFTV